MKIDKAWSFTKRVRATWRFNSSEQWRFECKNRAIIFVTGHSGMNALESPKLGWVTGALRFERQFASVSHREFTLCRQGPQKCREPRKNFRVQSNSSRSTPLRERCSAAPRPSAEPQSPAGWQTTGIITSVFAKLDHPFGGVKSASQDSFGAPPAYAGERAEGGTFT